MIIWYINFFSFYWSIVALQHCVSYRYKVCGSAILLIIFNYRLLQDIKYNSLCYTVNPCCLFYVQRFFSPLLQICPSPEIFLFCLLHYNSFPGLLKYLRSFHKFLYLRGICKSSSEATVLTLGVSRVSQRETQEEESLENSWREEATISSRNGEV